MANGHSTGFPVFPGRRLVRWPGVLSVVGLAVLVAWSAVAAANPPIRLAQAAAGMPKPVEKPVVGAIRTPVERPVAKAAEVLSEDVSAAAKMPVEETAKAADVPAAEPAAATVEAPVEEPAAVTAEAPVENAVVEAIETPAKQPAATAAETLAEDTAAEAAEVPADQPAATAAGAPAEEPAATAAEAPAEQPATEALSEDAAETAAEEPAAATAIAPAEEAAAAAPAENAATEQSMAPADGQSEPAAIQAQEPAAETAETPADKAAEKTAAAPASEPPAVEGLRGYPRILRDPHDMPEPVRKTWAALRDAARQGDIEALQPLIDAQPSPPTFAFDEIDQPILYLKSLSGDPEGREILAILLEVLESGFILADPDTPEAMYLWPYFARYPLEELSPQQTVEMFTLLTAGDYQDMLSYGAYIFFRVGISPDGVWHFFVAGD